MAPFGSLGNHKSRNNDFSPYLPGKHISKDRGAQMYYSWARMLTVSVRLPTSVQAAQGPGWKDRAWEASLDQPRRKRPPTPRTREMAQTDEQAVFIARATSAASHSYSYARPEATAMQSEANGYPWLGTIVLQRIYTKACPVMWPQCATETPTQSPASASHHAHTPMTELDSTVPLLTQLPPCFPYSTQ